MSSVLGIIYLVWLGLSVFFVRGWLDYLGYSEKIECVVLLMWVWIVLGVFGIYVLMR